MQTKELEITNALKLQSSLNNNRLRSNAFIYIQLKIFRLKSRNRGENIRHNQQNIYAWNFPDFGH